MKQTLKQKIIIGLALAGSFISGLAGGEVQAETQSEPDYSARFRTEATIGENTNISKSTIGIAPYSASGHNKYAETFRAYNYTGEEKGKHLDWTTAGAILPSLGIGDWTNTNAIFGSFGDKRGAGIQSSFKNGLTEFILNAEEMDAVPKHSTRFGIGLDYGLGEKINPGIGFDRVSTAKGDTDYFFGKLIFNPSNTDQIGFAARIADGVDKTNTVAGHYLHYGKDESWGTRARVDYSWNNNTDFRMTSFDCILVEKPTFSRDGSGSTLYGRQNGGLTSSQLFENPPTVIERVPLVDRSRGGFVGNLTGKFKDNAGNESGYVEGSFGYSFPAGDIQPGIIGTYRRDFSLGKYIDSLGASLQLKIGKNVCLEVGHNEPISGEGRSSTYFSGQYVRRF